MPHRAVLPMHCSANVGRDGDTALFFGLSGTGKTTLSADPLRKLIGDDEHGWSENGVFNFEGGCYAKCIRLSEKNEPQIWGAIRFGSVVENVVLRTDRSVDYDDASITENTRAAYRWTSSRFRARAGGHAEHIIFLTADALESCLRSPSCRRMLRSTTSCPGSRRSWPGPRRVGSEPEATFSTCFGAPFLPLPPTVTPTCLAGAWTSTTHGYSW